MFFDTLAGVIERHLPEFMSLMQQAHIFRFEKRDPDFSVGETVSQWEPDERTIENFRLPFPVIAQEECGERNQAGNYCLLLSVTDEAIRRLDFLLGQGKKDDVFIAAGSLKALPGSETNLGVAGKTVEVITLRAWEGSKKGGVSPVPSSTAWIDPESDRIDRLEKGDPVQQALAKYHKGEPGWDDDLRLAEAKECLKLSLRKLETNIIYYRLVIGVLSILVINEPARFIVEERPLQPVRDRLDIPRSACRPHYIILKPRQIRERFIWPDGTQGEDKDDESDPENRRKVTPHERRGHFRRLQAERFVRARGQVIWIQPMWIGPSEAVRGRNYYKVRLDL